jgi:probable rRNA maturation factor
MALLFICGFPQGECLVTIQEKVVGLTEAALARFVTRARSVAGLRGAVSVLVTSSRELRALNRRFRGKNKPTDVLSFPAMPGLMKGFAGDVAISAEIAAGNARRLGHTVAEEIRVLVLHGLLHLAGYDHERDDGQMERKEARLRKSLGLPVGLIERTGRWKPGVPARQDGRDPRPESEVSGRRKGLSAKGKLSGRVSNRIVSARAKVRTPSRAKRSSR